LEVAVNPGGQTTHSSFFIADETMASREFTVSRDTEVSGTRSARIGAVRTTVNLT